MKSFNKLAFVLSFQAVCQKKLKLKLNIFKFILSFFWHHLRRLKTTHILLKKKRLKRDREEKERELARV